MPNCFAGTPESGSLTNQVRIKYVGIHQQAGDLYEVVVERAGQKPYHLNTRLDLANHSPTGVCWGYGGSGPAQCALAILADYLKDDQRALTLYQDFKWAVIEKLPMNSGWELTDRDIENVITKLIIKRMQE